MIHEKHIINLQTVPQMGKEFSWDSNDDVFKDAKKDLEVSSGSLKCNIRPIDGATFEVKGECTIQLPLDCIRCNFNFSTDISFKIQDIVMVKDIDNDVSSDRNSSTPINLDTEWGSLDVDSFYFDMADYLRELIVINTPANPTAYGEDCFKKCDNFDDMAKYMKDEEIVESPFAKLSKLKNH